MEALLTDGNLTLLGGILGAIWTVAKSGEWFTRRRTARMDMAVQALEAGVEQTYRTYVRAIKEARADGKLTDRERRQARLLARESALAFGRTQGVDVLQALGKDYIDLWITRLVNKQKLGE